MTISNDIKYVGVNDHDIDLFEGQYVVPRGMAYNSYVIIDGKIAVMDTVDQRFGDAWLANIEATLAGRAPDYLVVQHMEPDHSANIDRFLAKYPSATVVASVQAFKFMEQFFGPAVAPTRQVVKEGDVLDLGAHKLHFVAAPMVHWPEVIVTYDSTDKVLFSADGFGKLGANDVEDPEGWDCEARRYYFGIVGKYGPQTQALLKKAAGLDIQTVCPLHGPVLKGEEIAHAVKQYDTWSSYGVESPGICIAYTSVYGHTKEAALLMKEELLKRGCPKVAIADLARDDMPETVEDAFRYGTLVLASPTYNADMFPFMKAFLDHLADHAYQNRRIALIENGTWAPAAAKAMRAKVEAMKGIEVIEPVVSIKSALSDETRAQIKELASTLVK
jgi:flavorubredoxin